MTVGRLSEAGEAYLALLHLNETRANQVRNCIRNYAFPRESLLTPMHVCNLLAWAFFRMNEFINSFYGLSQWDWIVHEIQSELETLFRERGLILTSAVQADQQQDINEHCICFINAYAKKILEKTYANFREGAGSIGPRHTIENIAATAREQLNHELRPLYCLDDYFERTLLDLT